MAIDYSVSVAAILWLIVFGQRQKTISLNTRRRVRLRREISKQLSAVVDNAIAVPIESEPAVIRVGSSPCQMHRPAVADDIEYDSVGGIGKIEAVAVYVNQNRSAVRAAGAAYFRSAPTKRTSADAVPTAVGPHEASSRLIAVVGTSWICIAGAVRRVPVPTGFITRCFVCDRITFNRVVNLRHLHRR